MSEKLKNNSGEQPQETEWDQFKKYVDAVNADRAKKAAEKEAVKRAEAEAKNRPLAIEDKHAGNKPLTIEDKQMGNKPLVLEDKQANKTPVLAIEDKQMNKNVLAIEDKQMKNKVLAIEDKQMNNKPLALEDKQMTAELQKNQEAEINRAKEDLIKTAQEAMESEQQMSEKELYDVVQSQMELEGQMADSAKIQKTDATPLTAINIDWTHDKKELAHDLAEQDLNAEVASGGLIKKLWKGTLLKKYFEKKYTKEYMKGERTDEKGRTVNDLIREQSPDVMERFVLGATEDMRYIHQEIGKQKKDGTYDGEKLIPADEKTNEAIKQAIIDYARKTLEPGQKVEDLDREFKNETARIMAEAMDDGRIAKGTKTSNYLKTAKEAARRYEEVAINAKNKAMQEEAMAQVMAGFQVYNGEARSNVRTEAHRDNIDKIVNAIESSKVGQFIPAEIVAGAAGIALGLTQTGVRAIAGAGGGIIASSAISGLKERNRITEDRARMMRDIANGMDYGNNDKTAKYEKRIGGTLYDMKKAGDLTKNLEKALENDGENRSEDILRAIAEARVRIDFSDSEQKDLIAYSSADKRGKERLDLDVAVIRAEKSLSGEDKKRLEAMKEEIRRQVIDGYDDESGEHHAGVSEKDKDFKKFRTISALKKSGKTLALGSAIFFGSQEAMAAIDPAKIGVFEKAGLLKTENNTDASETILASGFGRLRGSYEMTTGAPRYDIHENVSDPDQIKYYEEAGYTKVQTAPGVSGTKSEIVGVDPSASTAKVDVKYDGWANNGTKISDGNELRAHIENGKFISTMRGSSTMNGENIAYDPSTVKAYVTLGDSKFEVVGKIDEATGQMAWGENGIFTTPTGETIKVIGDNGEKLYKYFEIAADNGVDTDGVQHIIPLATDIGTNEFAGKIEQIVEGVAEEPATYTFIRDIPGSAETFIRDIDFSGIGFAPETARRGLGGAATRAEVAPEPTENAPAPAPEAPEAPSAPEAPTNLTYSRVTARTAPETAPAPTEAAPPYKERSFYNDRLGTTTTIRVAPGYEDVFPGAFDKKETGQEKAPEPTPAPAPANTAPAPAPEAAPSTTESEPTILRDVPENLRGFATDYENLVLSGRDVIGDDLANYLLSNEPITAENQSKMVNAIRNLDEDGKTALRGILYMRDSLSDDEKYQLNFGNALGLVLAQNPGILDQ